jgi:hypothetical protein
MGVTAWIAVCGVFLNTRTPAWRNPQYAEHHSPDFICAEPLTPDSTHSNVHSLQLTNGAAATVASLPSLAVFVQRGKAPPLRPQFAVGIRWEREVGVAYSQRVGVVIPTDCRHHKPPRI